MLTETKEIDKIEIINNIIQVREIIIIKKNEEIIASSFHRTSYTVNDDISSADAKVQAIAKAIWPEKFTNEQT